MRVSLHSKLTKSPFIRLTYFLSKSYTLNLYLKTSFAMGDTKRKTSALSAGAADNQLHFHPRSAIFARFSSLESALWITIKGF